MKKTLIDLFEQAAARYGEKSFLLEKHDGAWRQSTYRQVRERVLRVAAGLLETGIGRGERISILSEGRNDWIVSELGLLYAGAVSVPLSVKLEESNDLLFRLAHAEVSVAMVSANQLPKIRKIRDRLPLLRQVICFDEVPQPEAHETTLSEIEARGAAALAAGGEERVMAGAREVKGDDCATITYTSGTTSDPKGVMLTHRNYTANVEQSLSRVSIPSWYRTLIILPLDHCFAHVVGFYIMIACGATVATVQVGRTPMETLKNIPLNIREVKPHFLLSVPALAKNFRKSIESAIRAKGPAAERMFSLALRVAYAYNADGYGRGRGWRILLAPAAALFDRLLMRKVREAFGGCLQFFIGGGALLDTELQRFFYAVGMPMYQGYGLSEATPVISTNSPRKGCHRFGSSGMLLEPLDLKIIGEHGQPLPAGERGEIVIRGENVMAGYWKNPEATAETVRDGWLYTGDMGYMSPEGFLYVLGRFKSLLIAGDGEKYSPEGMEEAIVDKSPFIEQIMIYNNQSPFTSAVVVPDREAVRRHLKGLSGEEYARRAVELIGGEIAKYKSGGVYADEFPDRWLPAALAIVGEPFSEKNGLVNSTIKVVRGKVEEHYRQRIEALYAPGGRELLDPRNLAVFMEEEK